MACADAPVSRAKGCDHRGHVFTAAFISSSRSEVCLLARWHGSVSVQHAKRQVLGGPDARSRRATKTLFGSFATFLGASPDDAGGAELGWLFASVLQNAGNNLVKGGMHRVTLALAKDLRAHGGEIRTTHLWRRLSATRTALLLCVSQMANKFQLVS